MIRDIVMLSPYNNDTGCDGEDNSSTTTATDSLTSNTGGTDAAYASDELDSSYYAYKAFDGSSTSGKCVNIGTTNEWIDYEFATPPAINKYAVFSGSTTTRAPKSWSLLGSNTGSFSGEEVILDSQSNQTYSSTWTAKWFTFNNATAYGYIRLHMKTNNGDTRYLEVGEIKYIEAQC